MLALLLLAWPTCAPPQEAPSETAFQEGLTGIEALLAAHSWNEALERFEPLLDTHAGADYVRPHLAGLLEDWKRAAFWSQVKEPKADDVISGRLLRHSPSSGKLRVIYEPGTLDDFQALEDILVHPAHFSGPWTATLEGEPEAVAATGLGVELDSGEIWILKIGLLWEGDLSYTKHALVRAFEGEVEIVESAAPKELRRKEKKVLAKLSVAKGQITFQYEGKTVFRRKKGAGYGSLAVLRPPQEVRYRGRPGRLPGFEELIVDGRVDRGWIGGRIDEAMAEEQKRFEDTWERPAAFDAWPAFTRPTAEEPSMYELLQGLRFEFGETPPGFDPDLGHTLIRIRMDPTAYGKLRDALDRLPDTPFRDVMEFQLAFARGRQEEARERLHELRPTPDSVYERDLVAALLLLNSGEEEGALREFEALEKAHPDAALPPLNVARALLLLGRPEEAHRRILAGLSRLPASPSLRQLEGQVVKAAKGPAWERVEERGGEHFRVRTDGRRKQARLLSKVADEAWERCEEFFGPLPEGALPEGRPHSLVLVFAGQGSYLEYIADVSEPGQENTLGVYSPLLKQVIVWDQPNELELRTTLRHEIAHRYLDLLIGTRLPRWLNEGLAECFAASWDLEQEFGEPGLVDASMWALQEGHELRPLEVFLYQNSMEFGADEGGGYPQAWSLVHFLRSTTPENARRLEGLLHDLKAGARPMESMDYHLLRGVAALEDAYRSWLRETVARWYEKQ